MHTFYFAAILKINLSLSVHLLLRMNVVIHLICLRSVHGYGGNNKTKIFLSTLGFEPLHDTLSSLQVRSTVLTLRPNSIVMGEEIKCPCNAC